MRFFRRSRRRVVCPGFGLEPLESRLCLSVIPVAGPILLDPQSIAQQQGAANVAIASDAAGDFVATWDVAPNTFDTHVHAQRFNALGQAVGSEFQVDNFQGGAGAQQDSSVAMDSAGNFTVVWQGYDSGRSTSGVFMRQFALNGTPLTPGPVLISTLTNAVFVSDPQVAMDAAGDFVITWTQPGIDVDNSDGVLGEFFKAGQSSGTLFEANTFSIGNQFKPGIAMNASGSFVIDWLSDGQSINQSIGVYAQRFNNKGKPVGSEFQAYTQLAVGLVDHPSVAIAADGGFIIASDSQTADLTGALFTVRRFGPTGAALAPAQSFTDDGVDAGTALAFDSSGEAFFTRSSDGEVVGQLITPAGLLDGSSFTVYQASGFSAAFNPAVVSMPHGQFLVAFEGYLVPNVSTGVGAIEYASDAGQTLPPTDALGYAKRVGGAIDDAGVNVVTDAQGNVYVAGQIGINSATEIGTVVQKYTADGTLVWSKTFGPTGGDTTDFAKPTGLVVDSTGNVYIGGTFNTASDFDPGSGVTARVPLGGGIDSYILELNSSGGFVRVTTMGGLNTETAQIAGLGIDASDNVYAAGFFNGDMLLGSNLLSSNGAPSNVVDAFLWKLNPAGATQWAFKIGNDTTATAFTALAVDPSGNAYVLAITGFGDAVNFEPTGIGLEFGAAAFGTIVAAKYDTNGELVWANGYDQASQGTTLPTAIALDPQGDIYAAGIFASAISFNPEGAPVAPSGTNPNGFLLKLTNAGAFTWVRTVGGGGGTFVPTALAADPNGNIFEAAGLAGMADVDPGAALAILSSEGGSASVVSGFDSDGNLMSADLLGGGDNNVFLTGLTTDSSGRLYLTGGFTGVVDMDPGSGTTTLTSAGGKDLFFTRLSTAASPVPAIALSGNGAAIPAGESSPAAGNATDFGNSTANSGMVTHTFTITNQGNATLDLGDSSVQVTGADAGDFSVLAQPAATVAPGATTTFTVQFAPTDVNTRAATVTIASDDPSQPQFTFAVTGLGLQAGDASVLAVTFSAGALPATLLPGQKIKVPFVLTNVGQAAAKESVTFVFYFGPGDTLDTAVDVPLPGFTKSINLASGKPLPLTVSITAPGTIPPGPVRLFVVLRVNNVDSDAVSTDQSTLLWQFGTVAGKKSVKLVLPNPAGGSVTFSLSGNGTGEVIPGVPGSGGAWDLMLTGTDAKSSVTITTSSGKTATIHDVTDATDLKSFTAKTTDLSGDATFGGAVSTLSLGNALAGGQEIEIGGGVATPVTLTLGRVSDLSLASLSPVKSLTAIEWLDPSETRDTITAPSLATLKITGNTKLGSAGDFDADVLLSDAAPKQTLGTATIAGTLTGSVLRAAGNIGTVTVGRLDHATILAGFTTTPDGLPAQLADLGNFTLGTLTVRGLKGQAVSVIDSILAAGTINTVTLKDVDFDNGQTPFGVAAHLIKSYTRLTTGGLTVKLKSLQTPTANAEPGATGDFVVRVL